MSCLTKTEATARGNRLLKRMKGRGWKLRVSENQGWHYTVELGDAESGGISLRESDYGTRGYWYLMGRAPSVGNPSWSHPTNRHFADPNDAVRYAIRRAAQDVARQQVTVDLVAKALS